jgi:hypothetical protein
LSTGILAILAAIEPDGDGKALSPERRPVTKIVKCEVDPTRSVLLNTGRNADPARISQTFEPSRHVHAVAEDVSVLHNDVADVDAYSKFDPASRWHIGVKRGHAALPFGRTPQGIDDTCELDHPSKNRAGR